MASIGGLSTSTSSSLSSLRGYGGLASGLDRDELISGMTSGTQSKIDKQQQAKTKLEWQQEAYRQISDKMIGFAEKYTSSMSSSTNLFSDSLWSAASTSVIGANSKYIGVSGSSKAAAGLSILGVMQMAKNTTMTMKSTVSDRNVSTGAISTGWENVSQIGGKSLSFKVGDTTYSITLPYGDGNQYNNAQDVADAINAALKKQDVTFSTSSTKERKLSDFVKAGVDENGNLTLQQGDKTEGNTVQLIGGTALENLGFKAALDDAKKDKKSGVTLGTEALESKGLKLYEQQSFAQRMGGKSLTFNYNGTSKTIDLPSAGEFYQYASGKAIVDKEGYLIDEDGYRFDKDGQRVNKNGNLIDENGKEIKDENGNSIKGGEAIKFGKVDQDGNVLDEKGKVVNGKDDQPLEVQERGDQLAYLEEALQKSLDAAFGKGRVKAEISTDGVTNEKSLTFKTTTPDGEPDNTSILSITGGSTSLMASQGGMGIVSGESNRLNLNASLKNSGLAITPTDNDKVPADGKYSLNINGKEISFTENDSISSIMDKINNANAGVKISYMSMADKFVVESTEDGAGGEIKLSGSGAFVLFGEEIDSGDPSKAVNSDITQGQDAIVAVKYAGSDEVVEIHRGSNSFSIEGLNVTVKGEFGYTKDESGDKKLTNDINDAVTFDTNVNADKMAAAISDMVKEYNEIIELVNSQVSTRPDSDYFPLTDAQKQEMSESEIKLWEEKAKAGMLFGSSELRGLSDDLWWVISPKDQQAMEAMGISVSSSWQDNGKLTFDESKFRAAVEQDPDAVREMFTKSDGIATNMKSVMNKYVNTLGATKGILIEKAGSTKAPTSILNNSLKSEIDDIDKILENLKTRLKSEQDRYISQFTQLETLISQMNSQSSYLSGLGF